MQEDFEVDPTVEMYQPLDRKVLEMLRLDRRYRNFLKMMEGVYVEKTEAQQAAFEKDVLKSCPVCTSEEHS